MKRLALLLMLVLAPTCSAATSVQTRGAAKLEVQSDDAELSLADVITVTLTVNGGAGLVVSAPLELPTKSPWLRVERSEPTRQPFDGRIQWRIVYRFAPREPGKLVFTFPDVKFCDDASAEQTVSWQPIPFTVTTAAGELRDITSIEELAPIVPPDRTWLVGTGLGALAFFLIALLFVLRRLIRTASPRSPGEHALREWDRLMALGLPAKGRSERFITLLTTLVRRYLERQYAFPARRQTTSEFRRDVVELSGLTAEEKQFLTTFLERCESVKFAGMSMSPEECERWANETHRFLKRAGKPA